MQKLDFNKDGKLVAYTDNGCTDGKSAATEVKGTFEVSADVVNFILAKEYDLPAALGIELVEKCLFGHYNYEHLYCFVGNDRLQEILKSCKQRLDELSNVENELKRLRKAVDDFNRTRRFFERKIRIENV